MAMETPDGIIISSGSSSASSEELKRPRNCISSIKRKDSLLSRWKKSGLAVRRYLNCLDAKQSDSSTDEELLNKVKTGQHTKNNYVKKSSMSKHTSNIDKRLTDGSANGTTEVQNNNRVSMGRKCLHRDKICNKEEKYVYGGCCTTNGLLTDDYLSLHSSRNCTTDTDQSDWCQSVDLIESTCDCCSSQCDNCDMINNCHACKKMEGDQNTSNFYAFQGQDEDNFCSDHSKLLLDHSENHKLNRTERYNKTFKRSKIPVTKCLTDKASVETNQSGNNGIQNESDIIFCKRCHSEITINKKYQDADLFCRKCRSECNLGIFRNSSKTSYVDKSSERTNNDYSRNSVSKNSDKLNIKNDDMIHKRERFSLSDKKSPLKRENHRLTSIPLHSDSLSTFGKVDHSSMKHSLPEESPVVTQGYNGEDISDDIEYLESAIDYSPSGFLSGLARMSLENLSEESTDKIHISDDDSLPPAPSSIPGLNFAMPYLSDRLKNSIAQRLGQEGSTDVRNDQINRIEYQETEQLPDIEDEESFQGRQLVVDQSTENMTEEETLTDLLTNLEKIDMINNLLLSDQDDWDISRQIGTTADTNQTKDEENGSDGGEADDEFECDCQFCVGSSLDGDGCHSNEEVAEDRNSHESSEQNILSTVENTDYGFNFWMSDREDEDDSMFTINIEELSPLDLLMNDRRSELELMFENVIIQMLAVHPDLLGEQAPPPAAQSTIQNLPVTPVTSLQISQSLSCSICLCIFEECDSTTTLPCRHHFHPLCIKAWLSKSGTCPVCRFTLE
ncbi:E3 ubiquitin-protein ligase Praja2 [Mytilus galloprovincialis]|uniref:E3 ubiquitin-protein ligase Praja2 n=1 Tax=Mytilus galloprovincialis TaxID=29158 RepID=A0A8B6E606_MYTGA|nr:E3 ubiquitin-protein ligase Praja2 [Mytilus galloprovincialis]